MKWILFALLIPLVGAIALVDTLLWNVTHGFGNKTTVQQSFREITGVYKRLFGG